MAQDGAAMERGQTLDTQTPTAHTAHVRADATEDIRELENKAYQWIDAPTCWEWTAPQGSSDWLHARQGRITASKITGAVGESPFDRDPWALAASIACIPGVQDVPDEAAQARMAYGREHEPGVREWTSLWLKKPIRETGLMVWKKDSRFAASLDGIVIDDSETAPTRGIEIKCPVRMYPSLRGKTPEQIQRQDIYRTHYDQMMLCGVIAGLKEMIYVVCSQQQERAIAIIPVDYVYVTRVLYPCACTFHLEYVVPLLREHEIAVLQPVVS